MKFLILLMLSLTLAANDFSLMKASFEKGHIDRAISIARENALKGNVEAMYDLGLLYYAKGNTKEAKTWLTRSMKNDGKGALGVAIIAFTQAQDRRGYEKVMELLINVPKSRLKEALMNVSRDLATNRDDASAEDYLQLAELYYGDKVIYPDIRAALYLTNQAAKKGSAKAMELMGDAYWHSNLTQDTLMVAPHTGNALNIAMEYYRNAVQKNNYDAMAKLGKLHIIGPRNLRRIDYGVNLILRSAEHNSSVGAKLAAELYANGQGVRADRQKALKWYKKATDICDVNNILAHSVSDAKEAKKYADAYAACRQKTSKKRKYHLLFEPF